MGPVDEARLDWLCIGAQKAGTSTLYRLLRDHPDIAIPVGKEDPLFDRDVDESEVAAYLQARFGSSAAGARCGTVTPQYMSDPATAARVARFCPDARVVVLLRDPVARAFSHWQMSSRRGLDARPFAAAVDDQLRVAEPDWFRHAGDEDATYVVRGRYATILEPWFDAFGAERILAVLTDDLEREQAGTLARVQSFLGVEPRPAGEPDLRAHAAPPRHLLSGARRPVAGALRRVHLLQRLEPEHKERIAERIERVLARIAPRPDRTVEPEVAARLREAYASDRARLTALLGAEPPWA